MDELRAYEILKLEPGCSREEIKEAYAVLFKQFHPEEFPEEFQKIHTAYTTLIRGGRRGRRTEEPVRTSGQQPPAAAGGDGAVCPDYNDRQLLPPYFAGAF